jgi:hypothetical protein
MNLPRPVRLFLAGIVLPLLLASCFETKQEFTLNPDGSGKVVHECAFQNVNLMNDDLSGEDALKDAVRRLMENSKGVDAWSDVSFKQLDDGRMWFRGTAYFRKLDDLEIQNQSMMGFEWKPEADGKAVLSMRMKQDNDEEEATEKELSDEERAAKIKEERAQFRQSKPMLSAMMGTLKQNVSFKLPGTVTESSNFSRGTMGTLDLAFSGTKMIEAMETLIEDDEWMLANGFDQQQSPEFDGKLAALVFGEEAPVQATVSNATKPLFDYAVEVARAQKEAEKLNKQLGGVTVAAPAQGGELKSIRVVGVRLAKDLPKALDLRPFHNEPGYTLAVLAEFPGGILEVTNKSAITKAVASDGSDLIKGKREWDRRLGFPNLSADKASALFDVELKLPPAEAKGIREISGVIEYLVAEGTKEIELGFTELKAGAKGKELGAEIKKIEDGWGDKGTQNIELRLRIGTETLKNAWLVQNGVKTPLERRGHSGSDTLTTFTLEHKEAVPADASIMIEIHDDLKTYEVPFSLENLSLLGEPVGPGA